MTNHRAQVQVGGGGVPELQGSDGYLARGPTSDQVVREYSSGVATFSLRLWNGGKTSQVKPLGGEHSWEREQQGGKT